MIGRDKRIRTRPAEALLLHRYEIRYIWLGGKRDERTATYVEWLTRQWTAIERLREPHAVGPWWYSLTASGLRQRPIPDYS